MNAAGIQKTAVKTLTVFAMAAVGIFLMASLAKRVPMVKSVQDKIYGGI